MPLRNDSFNTLPDSNTATFRSQSQTFFDYEAAQLAGRYLSPFVYSGGIHNTSASLVSNAFSTEAFVPERINQPSAAITYVAANNDVVWVIISSTDAAIPGWTRVGTTAYYFQTQGNTTPAEPTIPANSLLLMQVTITAGTIATVIDRRTRTPSVNSVASYGSLAQAITAIGTQESELVINRPQIVGANTTIPATIRLVFTGNGSFDVQSGITLTMNNVPECGPQQIFSGSGSIVFPRDAVIRAEWFASLQAAVNSLSTNSGGVVTFSVNITQATQIVLPAVSISFIGLGQRIITSTLITNPLFYFSGAGNGQVYRFRDLTLIGPGATSNDGLYVKDTGNSGVKVVLENFGASNFGGGTGVYLYRVYFAHLSHVDLRGNKGGIHIEHGSNAQQWYNVQVFNNTDFGAKIQDNITTFGWFGGRVELNGYGVWFKGLTDGILSGLHFEGNNASGGKYSMYFDGTGNVNTETNNRISILSCRNADAPAYVWMAGSQNAANTVTFINSPFDVRAADSVWNFIGWLGQSESVSIQGPLAPLSLYPNWQPGGLMLFNKTVDGGGAGLDYLYAKLEQIGIGTFTATLTNTTSSIRNTVRQPVTAYGQHITFVLKQDATGGRNVSFDTQYITAWSNTGNTANKTSSVTFVSDGTNWIQVGAQSPYM